MLSMCPWGSKDQIYFPKSFLAVSYRFLLKEFEIPSTKFINSLSWLNHWEMLFTSLIFILLLIKSILEKCETQYNEFMLFPVFLQSLKILEKHSAKEWFYNNNNSLLLGLTFCKIFPKHQNAYFTKKLSRTLLQLKALPHSEFSSTYAKNIKPENKRYISDIVSDIKIS